MLFCTSAPMFPSVIESTAVTHTIQNQPGAPIANKYAQQHGKCGRLWRR